MTERQTDRQTKFTLISLERGHYCSPQLLFPVWHIMPGAGEGATGKAGNGKRDGNGNGNGNGKLKITIPLARAMDGQAV